MDYVTNTIYKLVFLALSQFYIEPLLRLKLQEKCEVHCNTQAYLYVDILTRTHECGKFWKKRSIDEGKESEKEVRKRGISFLPACFPEDL